jgi:2-phospho-L-lactate/phosphoenolpyruvate guanylyltransferase
MRLERMSMRDTWLCVLARDPGAAKTRLSGVLGQAARADLAVAMLEDVLAAASTVTFARRLVVTESELVSSVARAAGAESFYVSASGTNDAASAAVRRAVDDGAARALLLAADLPYLLASDLELLLAEDAPVVIAPDRHRRGTNALLLAPPSAISPAFGADSFRAHRELAQRASSPARIVTSRGLATDVDDPEDLRLLRREPGLGRHTNELLSSVAFSAASPR